MERREVLSYLNAIGFTDGEEIRSKAKDAYIALSLRLGENAFFFGKEPTSIDAIIFGHLADVLAERAGLHTLLAEFPNLTAYYSRILATYFVSSNDGQGMSSNTFLEYWGLKISLPSSATSNPPKLMEGVDYLNFSSNSNTPFFSRPWEESGPGTKSKGSHGGGRRRGRTNSEIDEEDDHSANETQKERDKKNEELKHDYLFLLGSVGIFAAYLVTRQYLIQERH